jgi:hypothetical protein
LQELIGEKEKKLLELKDILKDMASQLNLSQNKMLEQDKLINHLKSIISTHKMANPFEIISPEPKFIESERGISKALQGMRIPQNKHHKQEKQPTRHSNLLEKRHHNHHQIEGVKAHEKIVKLKKHHKTLSPEAKSRINRILDNTHCVTPQPISLQNYQNYQNYQNTNNSLQINRHNKKEIKDEEMYEKYEEYECGEDGKYGKQGKYGKHGKLKRNKYRLIANCMNQPFNSEKYGWLSLKKRSNHNANHLLTNNQIRKPFTYAKIDPFFRTLTNADLIYNITVT